MVFCACLMGGDVEERIFLFNKAIVDKTYKHAGAYKLNLAFYLGQGEPGIAALVRTIQYIRIVAPWIPVILDSKSGDIDNTNIGYVEYVFNLCGADAITVHPYLGKEAMAPFLAQKDKGVIVLCRTSNKGAGEFQDLIVEPKVVGDVKEPLYCRVARHVARDWNYNGNCGVVVGATWPSELALVRQIVGNMLILIPGLGKQGGDLRKSVRAGMNENRQGFVVNSSRGIIFKSSGEDFAEVAEAETIAMSKETNLHRLDDSLTNDEVIELFESAKAWLKDDHFVYSTGLHGWEYLNKDAVYPYVFSVMILCRAIAARYHDRGIEVVAAAEKGGIILSTWTAYFLSKMTGRVVHSVFAEKEPVPGSESSIFVFKRGYVEFVKGKKVLVVEDIINTAGTVHKMEALVSQVGGLLVDSCGLINRGETDVNALARVAMEKVPEDQCPKCLAGIPVNENVGKGADYMKRKREAKVV